MKNKFRLFVLGAIVVVTFSYSTAALALYVAFCALLGLVFQLRRA